MAEAGRFRLDEIGELTLPQVRLILGNFKMPNPNRREFANAREVAAYLRDTATSTPKPPDPEA